MKVNKSLFIVVLSTLSQIFLTSVAFSQPVVKVSSSKSPQEIKKQAELYLEQLGVQENIHLTIRESSEMPEALLGITIPHSLQDSDYDQMFTVLLDDRLNKSKQILVLAHEMIHVKQYAKKELIVNPEEVIWKGQKFHYARAFNLQTPWEKEAYHHDRPLATLVRSTYNRYKDTLVEESPRYAANTSRCGKGEYVWTGLNCLLPAEKSSIN